MQLHQNKNMSIARGLKTNYGHTKKFQAVP